MNFFMNLSELCKRNISLFICVLTLSAASNKVRNPFEFAVEKPKEEIKKEQPQNAADTLAKWNIKEIGNDLIIMETEEGQIRTIQVSSFM